MSTCSALSKIQNTRARVFIKSPEDIIEPNNSIGIYFPGLNGSSLPPLGLHLYKCNLPPHLQDR